MLENVECVDQTEVQSLIDQWLKSELDADTYRREAPEGEIFAGVVLRKEPAWKADSIVRRISFDAVAEADDDPFETLNADEYVVREVSDQALERAARRKVFEGAGDRVYREDGDVAEEHVKALFSMLNIPIDEFSAKFETATLMMMRAHGDLWKAMEQRDAQRWRPLLADDPAAPLLARLASTGPLHGATPPQADPTFRPLGKSISVAAVEAIEAIARKNSFPPKRRADYENAVRVFIDFLTDDPDLLSIGSERAGEFMRALERFPSNASKRTPYRDLGTFAEKLGAALAVDEEQTLEPTTINTKYLTPLRAIYAWHKKGGVKMTNPFEAMSVEKARKDDPNKQRRDVSLTEIQKMLSLPLFTGSKGLAEAPLYIAGAKRVNDWRFWVPLICLFSGMRLNEACGLGVSDVRTSPEGIAYFHVRDDIDGQRLKSNAARRRIPVHSSLVEIGFLRFVATAARAGQTRLFEDLEGDGSGYFSARPSKFFADLRPRYIDKKPEHPGRLTFHSIRHTVTTRLRAAGVREDVSKALVGHEQDDVHGHYGDVDIPTLQDAVEKIVYPGLDLSAVAQPDAKR